MCLLVVILLVIMHNVEMEQCIFGEEIQRKRFILY
jgi:hypothetical protein